MRRMDWVGRCEAFCPALMACHQRSGGRRLLHPNARSAARGRSGANCCYQQPDGTAANDTAGHTAQQRDTGVWGRSGEEGMHSASLEAHWRSEQGSPRYGWKEASRGKNAEVRAQASNGGVGVDTRT